MTYTYTPKEGDTVVFPNGIQISYDERHETITVAVPSARHSLWIDSLNRTRGIFGVRERVSNRWTGLKP